ncbi:NADH-ubiquinone oxidoreductase chain 3, partial [Atta colombica]
HHALINKNINERKKSLLITIILGIFFLNKEKISPFECGFNPSSRARLSFRTQFFIIKLIFLIFDIEIALLLPLTFISINFNPFIISYSFTFLFILICNIGLYIEYNEYSLD